MQFIRFGGPAGASDSGAALILLQSGSVKHTQLSSDGNEVVMWMSGSGDAINPQAELPSCNHSIASVPTSPLRKGESVEIRKIAPEDSCSADMLVMTRWSNRNLAVPLSQLKPIGVDEPTKQAIEDWHYLRDRRQTLIPLSRGKSEAELQSDLATFDETAAAAEIAEMRKNETQLNQDENKTYSDLQQKQRELEALENGVGAEIALQQRRNAEAKLTSCTREWAVKRIAEILLSHAIDQYRNKQEQPLLSRAGELFSLLTADRFVRIEQAFDDSDNLQLVGRRNTNETVTIEGMSEGTQDQLYLALRLAYLEDYAKTTEPIPFIGDDLLTSFDDERTRRGLAALAATGDTIQPILFTHHSKVVELAQLELGAKVDVIMLQPN